MLKLALWALLALGLVPALWSAWRAYDALRIDFPRRYSDFVKGPQRLSFWQVLRREVGLSDRDPRIHDTRLWTTEPFMMYPRFWAVIAILVGSTAVLFGFAFLMHFPPKAV